MRCWQYIISIIASYFIAASEKIPCGQNLIVFIIDGYGKALLNQSDIGFRLLTQNGVYSDFLKPVYPTHNYPNWMSLVTGLYAENHGFGANYMWDRVRNRRFWNGETNRAGDTWWPDGVVPAWYTTGKSNVDVHCYWMPGCDLPHQDMIVQVPQELFLIRYAGVQAALETFGLRSDELKQALINVDLSLLLLQGISISPKISVHIFTLQQKLEDAKLFESTNLMVISTHGLYTVEQEEQFSLKNMRPMRCAHCLYYMFILEIQSIFELKLCDQWAPMGDYDENEQPLVSVYQTIDLPDRLHWKKFQYMPEIVLITRPGATVLTRELPSLPPHDEQERDILSTGGWDNENLNMHGIFFARGPAFKEDYEASHINIVDIYQVMMNIFGIEPPYRHNGTWSNVEDLLNSGWEARSIPENMRAFTIL
ncbi:Ectonucleotide pyrophosphatase/phosphodiesterase family member 6 [Dirofilaria immitis]|nr:Ectonucleotide pyrophosphatase/phosphodiesterase family member 6 [Dirofilaria immitis]